MILDENLRNIRKSFFALRNGILSDAMRNNGDPHSMIMGCMLTDVMNVAAAYQPSVELASALWQDTKHRECRMIAPMLYPYSEMDLETATEWFKNVESTEIADILCHRLLRKLPFATKLVEQFTNDDDALNKYTAYRLMLNLLIIGKLQPNAELKEKVEAETPTSILKPVLNSILEEFVEL